jgi:hypothetical protein
MSLPIFKKIKIILANLAKKIIYQIEEIAGYFFTYHWRPINAEKVKINLEAFTKLPPTAIVVQGPILSERNFTRETLKIYRKNFPQAILILSTWDDEKAKTIEEIKEIGVEIILNKKPAYTGLGNINYQLTSSFVGINKAKELGAEYVLKNRTDQRMYDPNSLAFLYNLTKNFPVAAGYRQKKRIIGLDFATLKNRMHEIGDMLVYGQIDDMLIYWGIPLETPEYSAALKMETGKITAGQRGPLKQSEFPICEKKLTVHFLESIGRTLTWTFADSQQSLADHFCVVDADDLDLYWHKYARLREHRRRFYDQSDFWEKHRLSFAEWLNIYSSLHKF